MHWFDDCQDDRKISKWYDLSSHNDYLIINSKSIDRIG